MTVETQLLVVLLAPLMSAGLIWMFFRRAGAVAATLSVVAAGVVAVVSLKLLYTGAFAGHGRGDALGLSWLQFGGFEVTMGFLADPVAGLMLLVVSFVGFWIHVFSIGYMRNDAARGRYFGGLSIFMFSMLGIVLADNLLMIFVFWELVGFSSYFLIGHYTRTEEAAKASQKAFIVNRVGDLGFLLGILMVYWQFGTVDLVEIREIAAVAPDKVSSALGLLLFCGVLGKSAQMPLHVWLPDAMAGPTPVSALIHAATMVAAGVYLLSRIPFLFTPLALTVILWVGVVTAVCAALWAFAQTDIKKVLAYSTLSQLGYMVAAFGLGTRYGLAHGEAELAVYYGVGAALFHLTTHAFFKALLFLGAGSVIDACHHEQEIHQMGGMFKRMPWTGLTFALGTLAIAGMPFLSGFFSKDAILYIAKVESHPAFIVLAVTAVLTAAYMGRLFVTVFLGHPNSDQAEQAKESSWVMVLPLVVLAAGSVVAGYAVVYPSELQEVMHSWVKHPHGTDHWILVGISVGALLIGGLIAFLFYGVGAKEDALRKRAYPIWLVSHSRFYFDEAYYAYTNSFQQRIADTFSFLDTVLISGLLVRGSAGVVGVYSLLARMLHTGRVNAYAWWFFLGVLVYSLYAFGVFQKF